MVLTIAVSDSAGKVDNWLSGRADLSLSFLRTICSQFPIDFGLMCMVLKALSHVGWLCKCQSQIINRLRAC
jgi:hypothetical protein